MLKFKEVMYLYTLTVDEGDINTNEGYAYVDYKRCLYWHPLMALDGVFVTPWYFLKEDSTLYLMREEPIFYA